MHLLSNPFQATFNPIIALEGMDPTSLWLTEYNEYRFHGTSYGCAGAQVYGSLDIKSWQPVACVPMPDGDCLLLCMSWCTFLLK